MNSRVNNPLFQNLTGLTDIDADDIDCSTLTTTGDIVCNGNINVVGNVLTHYTYAEWLEDFNIRIGSDVAFGGNLNVNTGKTYLINNQDYISQRNTDDLSEGSSNLYYTDNRVANKVSNLTSLIKTTGNLCIGTSTDNYKLNLWHSDSVAFNDSQILASFSGNKDFWNINTGLGIRLGSGVYAFDFFTVYNSNTGNWDLRISEDTGMEIVRFGGTGYCNLPSGLGITGNISLGGANDNYKLNLYHNNTVGFYDSQILASFNGNKNFWNTNTGLGIRLGDGITAFDFFTVYNSNTGNWDLRISEDTGMEIVRFGGTGYCNLPSGLGITGNISLGGANDNYKLNLYHNNTVGFYDSQILASFNGNKDFWNINTGLGIRIGGGYSAFDFFTVYNSNTGNWDLRISEDTGTELMRFGGNGYCNVPSRLGVGIELPTQKLEVVGTTKSDAYAGRVYNIDLTNTTGGVVSQFDTFVADPSSGSSPLCDIITINFSNNNIDYFITLPNPNDVLGRSVNFFITANWNVNMATNRIFIRASSSAGYNLYRNFQQFTSSPSYYTLTTKYSFTLTAITIYIWYFRYGLQQV